MPRSSAAGHFTSNSDFVLRNLVLFDVFLHGLQSPPEMGFFMRFDGVKRIQVQLRKEGKELVKVEIPFSHRKMFIHLFVIIVEVNLTQKPSQGFHPNGEGGLAEDIVMARVKAESKTG